MECIKSSTIHENCVKLGITDFPDEVKQMNEMLKEDVQRLQKEKQVLEEETQPLVEANESLERQMVEVQHNDDNNTNDEPEVKGKKRSNSGGSGKANKIAKIDDIHQSSRARLPSKKVMKP
ncbi:hypothetical protein F4604DRAFT_1929270 [Suillus subluteus]|nr:hypothetical protein F4604DRAFT_1929270 [Suillus subluteus]